MSTEETPKVQNAPASTDAKSEIKVKLQVWITFEQHQRLQLHALMRSMPKKPVHEGDIVNELIKNHLNEWAKPAELVDRSTGISRRKRGQLVSSTAEKTI